MRKKLYCENQLNHKDFKLYKTMRLFQIMSKHFIWNSMLHSRVFEESVRPNSFYQYSMLKSVYGFGLFFHLPVQAVTLVYRVRLRWKRYVFFGLTVACSVLKIICVTLIVHSHTFQRIPLHYSLSEEVFFWETEWYYIILNIMKGI